MVLVTGEPNPAYGTPTPSIWYEYVSSFNGSLLVDMSQSETYAAAHVFLNPSNSLATLVYQYGLPNCFSLPYCVRVEVLVGTRLALQVQAYYGGGPVTLRLLAVTPPPNDNFDHRTQLTGTPAYIAGSTLLATHEPGEVPIAAGAAASIWFSWTAPGDGVLTVSTAGSDFALAVAVYTDTNGTLAGLAPLGVFAGCSYRSVCTQVYVHDGQRVVVAVDGPDGATGGVPLTLTFEAPPSNDDFADRVVLAPGKGVAVAVGTTTGATHEVDEACLAYGASSSVWCVPQPSL